MPYSLAHSFLCSIALTFPADGAERIADFDAWVDAEMKQLEVPGLALAVVGPDGILLEKVAGVADLESKAAVTRDTVFPIGSSSKPMTATLAALLVSDGTLDWDDPIVDYLPEFELQIDSEDPMEQVTLRDLLAHRTGLFTMEVIQGAVNWEQDPDFDQRDPAKRATRASLLAAATKIEPTAPFRTRHLYSNISMIAAAEACGVAAKQPWDRLMQERLFGPLGMAASGTSIRQFRPEQEVAKGYLGEPGKWQPAMRIDMDVLAPAGGVNSTLADMIRYLQLLVGEGMYDGKRLVSGEALKEMWTPQVGGADLGGALPNASYGLGWFVRDRQGVKLVEHGGNALGYSACVAILPERHIGVVMLSNALPNPMQWTVGAQLIETLFGEGK